MGGTGSSLPFLARRTLLRQHRADGVRRDERPADRLALGRERLDEEQLEADEVLVLRVATTSPITRASC
jgi:hypothetical protein